MDGFFSTPLLINPCSLRFLSLTCLHCFHSTLPSCLDAPEWCSGTASPQKCEFPESFAGTGDVRHLPLKGSDGPRRNYHSPDSTLFFLLSRIILGIEIVLTAGIPWSILWKITLGETTISFCI